MAFLQDGTTALVTATDGRIWRLNLANHSGAPLVDPPRMAYGIHDAPVKPLFMRLPARLLMALPQQTGVLVVSPDGSTPLYSALYDGGRAGVCGFGDSVTGWHLSGK